jgi:hypothetical protein
VVHRDVRDADRVGHARLVMVQPGAFPFERLTPGFNGGRLLVSPGALGLALEEPLDRPVDRFAAFEHDHVS